MKKTKEERMTDYLKVNIEELEHEYYDKIDTIIQGFIKKFGIDADMKEIAAKQHSIAKRVRSPDAAFGYILVKELL